ncbi:hypothetical protein CN938_31190, partial [Bacillus thuringiensis]
SDVDVVAQPGHHVRLELRQPVDGVELLLRCGPERRAVRGRPRQGLHRRDRRGRVGRHEGRALGDRAADGQPLHQSVPGVELG